MTKHDVKAEWTQIDAGTLTAVQQAAYTYYRELRRQAAAARDAFEATMQEGVPEGERMVFGYNFGKLSVAIVPDERKAMAPKVKAQSLTDYLAARRANGLGT